MPRASIFGSKIGAILWALGICTLSGWLIFSAASGPLINTNLMALLPKSERDPVVIGAIDRVAKRFERHIALLIGARDFDAAKGAARDAKDRLADTRLFSDLRLNDYQDLVQQAASFYFPLRFQLLDNGTRTQIQEDRRRFEHSVLARYFNPQSPLRSDLIDKDPLLLLPRFLEGRSEAVAGGPEIRDGYLTVEANGVVYVVLIGSLAASPFSYGVQQQLMPLLDGIRAALPGDDKGAHFLLAGVLPHAAAGTESALDEMSTVGLGSMLGIILLLVVIFRSVRPYLLTLVAIALGCLGGFAACIAVFGEVHLLTMVFGASLVGISVDYALHFFCERYRFDDDWSPPAAIRHIFPGISLGLITSVIGFVGLFFAPFPGMQGMALFSIVGLSVAFGCVVIGYPPFTRGLSKPKITRPLSWARAYSGLWTRSTGWLIGAGGAMFALIVIVGCLRIVSNDDVRLLQTPDEAVMAEELRTRELIGRNLASQFFLVEGSDAADFLRREEGLTARLRTLQGAKKLSGYLAISDFVASPDRQAENRELVNSLITGDDSVLDRIAEQLGLPDATRKAFVSAFDQASGEQPATLEQWYSHPVSTPYRRLWLGDTPRGVMGVVGLRGVYDLGAARALAESDPKVHFVDPAGDVSDLFGKYRVQTIWLTLLSYSIVMLLLIIRYGFRGGLLVIAPPAIAAAVSVGTLGLLGEPISLFNIMALLLVLGIGVDYALFFRETGTENPSTLVAIAMSCMTTLLAFGLLALSATTAIHSFGLTIMIGIVVALLLSPIAGWSPDPDRSGNVRA